MQEDKMKRNITVIYYPEITTIHAYIFFCSLYESLFAKIRNIPYLKYYTWAFEIEH